MAASSAAVEAASDDGGRVITFGIGTEATTLEARVQRWGFIVARPLDIEYIESLVAELDAESPTRGFVSRRLNYIDLTTFLDIAGKALLRNDKNAQGGSGTSGTGNQTTTMIVRALALGQITRDSARKLFVKEISVSALNGLIWGSVVGLFAFLIYHSWTLGLVMTGAMVLNLLLAAVMGVAIPLAMQKFGRDPAIGSSVMITAITDSGGFFIFLGLSTIFLI